MDLILFWKAADEGIWHNASLKGIRKLASFKYKYLYQII